MLIIAGGKGDPDLVWLQDAAKYRNVDVKYCFCNSKHPTQFSWDLDTCVLDLDNMRITPKDKPMLYIRYSMFDNYGEKSMHDCSLIVESWYLSVRGWALANEQVGLLNRHAHVLGINKALNLHLAKSHGFDVPETCVMNNISARAIENKDSYVVKVIGDGEPTTPLEEALENCEHDPVFNSRPWIVQEKLDYPEMRIFRVGRWLFAFEIWSSYIDHREDKNIELKPIDVPDYLSEPVMRFTDGLNIDYGALDFKTCRKIGRYKFLEINTAPTFSGYDKVIQGKLSDAIILHLQQLTGA